MAGRAEVLEPGAAFPTELRPVRTLVLALSTAHLSAPHATIAGLEKRGKRSCSGLGRSTFFPVLVLWYHPCTMAQGLHELIGRVMIDPEFLDELRHSPDTVLSQYELTDDERAAVRQAVERLESAPAPQAYEFRNALLRRVAT